MIKDKLKKARELLNKAEKEIELYKLNHNFSYSSQACEKCWVACNLIIEHKANIELRTGSIGRIKPYAEDVGMLDVALQCFALHIYHYEGSIAYTEEDLIYDVESAIEQLRELID